MARKLYLILAAIIIAIIGVAAFALINGGFKAQPDLQVPTQTVSGITDKTATLSFEVTNNGGDATGVVITAASEAFETGVTQKISVAAQQTVTATCQVTVKDVDNKDYPVTLTYTADGGVLGDVSGTVGGDLEFRAVPNLELVPEWLHGSNVVGTYNYTMLYVTLKSNTIHDVQNATVFVTVEGDVPNLVVNPSPYSMIYVRANEQSEKVGIAIATYDSPAGSYPVQVKVEVDDYDVATETLTLEVRG